MDLDEPDLDTVSLATVMAALGDDVRLRIVQCLAEQGPGLRRDVCERQRRGQRRNALFKRCQRRFAGTRRMQRL